MGAPYPRPSYPRCSPPMVLLLLPLTPPLCRSHGSPRALSRAASLLPAPPHRRRVLRNRCQGRIVASNATTTPVRDEGAAAVVWFKHDLRIDDHPGLAAAVAEPRRPVVPLYVFDRRDLAGYSDKMLELLLFALKDLKMALKSQESDLLIGLRNAEDVVLKLVNEFLALVERNRYRQVLFLQKRKLNTECAVFWSMLNHLYLMGHSHGEALPR